MSSSSGSASLAHEMIDKLRVSELKALCSEKNLTQYGKKGVLVKRPKDHVDRELWSEQVRQPDLPPTPESLGEGECRAILMGTAKIGTDDAETIESARESLHTVLEDDELEVDHNLPQLAVGNRRGLELASLPDRVRVLESSLAKVQHKLSVRETTIMSLQGQVNDLTLNADSHRAIRQRFVVFFKRDKAPDSPLDDYDHKCMAEGNSVAHGGDAKADAELYRGFKARVDFHIYKRLYGYQPEIIWRIDHTPTLALLNLHATIKADIRKEASEKFTALFMEFVDRFETSNFNPTYSDYGHNTLVTKAYREFCDCVGDEVKVIPPSPKP